MIKKLDWFSHISLGLFLGYGLDYFLDFTFKETLFYYPFIALGSILPDIDIPQSKIGKILFPISIVLSKLVKHRTLTHSIVVITILFFIAILIWGMNTIIVGLMLGSIFHIIGDLMTPSGVALIYPISNKRFSPIKKQGRFLYPIN